MYMTLLTLKLAHGDRETMTTSREWEKSERHWQHKPNSAVENARNISIVEFYVSCTERAFQQPLPSVYLQHLPCEKVILQQTKHASAPCGLFVQYAMTKANSRAGLKSLTLLPSNPAQVLPSPTMPASSLLWLDPQVWPAM